jgi:hypothetical protein
LWRAKLRRPRLRTLRRVLQFVQQRLLVVLLVVLDVLLDLVLDLHVRSDLHPRRGQTQRPIVVLD